MKLFLSLPTMLCYMAMFMYLCAFLICAIICRREKSHSIKVSQKSVGGNNKESIQRKKGMASRIYSNLYPYFYGLIRYMSIFTGKIPSHRIRKFLLKNIFCMRIDKNAIIYGGFEIRSPWNIVIGRSVIGVGALLDGRKGILIEDDVCLAQSVSVYTEQHDINDPMFRTNHKGGPVTIKNHAWISSKTTILPQCVVEEGTIIASGATLTKSTIPYGVYAGLPAKIVSHRESPMIYTLGGKEYWHFY